ncbi:MAG TPA: hypothetical protein VGL10_08905 [Gammaproteobacteria bacterium]
MNTNSDQSSLIGAQIKRVLGFKALRSLRKTVNSIEAEELTDRKILKVLWIVMALLIATAAFFVYRVYQAPTENTRISIKVR